MGGLLCAWRGAMCRGTTLSAAATSLLLVLTAALSACSAAPEQPDPPSAEPAAVADNVVTEGGLTLDVGGVTVEFPAGSATGAEVAAEPLDSSSAPTEVAAMSTDPMTPLGVVPLADGVSLSLDDGQAQPSSPVTVTFPLPTESLPVIDDSVDDTAMEDGGPSQEPLSLGDGVAAGNVAFVVESSDGGVELVPAVFDEATGTVSGQVPHFSGIWPVSIDIGAMVDTVLLAVGAISPEPPCADQPVTVGEERYTVLSDPLMWMCLAPTADGAGLSVGATANAAFPFFAEPDVSADAGVSTPDGTAAAVASAWASDFFDMVPEGKVAVFPSGQTTFSYAEAPGDLVVDFEPAPELLLVSILAEVGSLAFSMSPAELAETFGQLECMGGVGELIGQAAGGALSPAVGAEILGAFFSCAGTVAELSPAQEVVVALFSAAPQLLVGTLWGAITTVAGASSFSVNVRVSGAGDPISAASLAPFVGTWSGPVVQTNPDSDYSVEVTISATADGFVTAQVRYPELDNCQGYWDQARLTGSVLRMVEHIDGYAGSCVETVDVVVKRVGDRLSYKSVWDGDSVAKGMLTRGPYEATEANGSARWPTGANEGPPALTVWLGANMYNPAEWIACDDAGDWCLVGGTSEHMLVQMDGLVDLGTVTDRAADPVAELVSLGAPPGAAAQIMN
jgi:hypothetical protein